MYYSDYNRSYGEPWESPRDLSRWDHPASPPPKKRRWTGVLAICLIAILLFGVISMGLQLFYLDKDTGDATNLLAGEREGVTVDISAINTESELSIPQVYALYVNSTVGIAVESVGTNVFGQATRYAASGSGFVISEDGYLVTNYHVVENASTISVSFYDGNTYPAVVVGREEGSDLAVLKIEAENLTPVVFGDSSKMHVGETVLAIGNPLGELTFTLTSGIVSALDRSISFSDGTTLNMIQVDCAINAGNSGGPLFNLHGELIGITTAKYAGNSTSATSVEGLGFAIPINDVMEPITDIIEHGYVTGKPYMGIIASTNKSPAGAYIESVTPDSCAETADLLPGDVITAIDDTSIANHGELIAAKDAYHAGDSATLTVFRNGATLQLTIVFDEAVPSDSTSPSPAPSQSLPGTNSNPFPFWWIPRS